eukprot:TRINITY_DN10850_c0_g1_i2.p1 TRINITY_DN10850_c0_g1~~TRINITY_DN10850_c0_g1_i2.p1  ORF type:complete len:893 (+),score=262.72 TRINITY_DN10850_c0_g1_i2:67-2745(+)
MQEVVQWAVAAAGVGPQRPPPPTEGGAPFRRNYVTDVSVAEQLEVEAKQFAAELELDNEEGQVSKPLKLLKRRWIKRRFSPGLPKTAAPVPPAGRPSWHFVQRVKLEVRTRHAATSRFLAREAVWRGGITEAESSQRSALVDEAKTLLKLADQLRLMRTAVSVVASGLTSEGITENLEAQFGHIKGEIRAAEALKWWDTVAELRDTMYEEAAQPVIMARPWREEEEQGEAAASPPADGTSETREVVPTRPTFAQRFTPVPPVKLGGAAERVGKAAMMPQTAARLQIMAARRRSSFSDDGEEEEEEEPPVWDWDQEEPEETEETRLLSLDAKAALQRLEAARRRNANEARRRKHDCQTKGAKFLNKLSDRDERRYRAFLKKWAIRQRRMADAVQTTGGATFGTRKLPLTERAPLPLARHEAAGSSAKERFFHAALKGDIDPFRRALLVDGGLDDLVLCRDSYGRSPLHFAAYYGHVHLLAYCIDPMSHQDAYLEDPDSPSQGAQSPRSPGSEPLVGTGGLTRTRTRGVLHGVRPWGKDWHTRSRQGLLHYAALGGQLAVCELLVPAARRAGMLGLELTCAGSDGLVPHRIAEEQRYPLVQRYLQRIAEKVRLPPEDIADEGERQRAQPEHQRATEQGRTELEQAEQDEEVIETHIQADAQAALHEERYIIERLRAEALEEEERMLRRIRRESRQARRALCRQQKQRERVLWLLQRAAKERLQMLDEDLLSAQYEKAGHHSRAAAPSAAAGAGAVLMAPFIGIDVTDGQTVPGLGVVKYYRVVIVRVSGAAELAGVRDGEMLLAVGDTPISSLADLRAALAACFPTGREGRWSDSLRLTLATPGGESRVVTVHPAHVPSSPTRRYRNTVVTHITGPDTAAALRSPRRSPRAPLT